MEALVAIAPWLLPMVILLALSALFSASEAAFFYLKLEQRRRLQRGGSSQRVAFRLLHDPDRLLTAILFWNLVINVAYFSLASIVGIRLEREIGTAAATLFAGLSLLTIIFFSEMLPKSFAVMRAETLVGWAAIPISLAVRMVDPLMPLMRGVNAISQRIIWPGFKPETYLQVQDLERAIEVSTQSKAVKAHEEMALRGIVSLSDLRLDEVMRPRMRFVTFTAPVHLTDLGEQMTPSGYVIIEDPGSGEVISALNLSDATSLPEQNLEGLASKVLVLPWCADAAEAFQQMLATEREVVVVVNEIGETIGVVTLRDLLDTIFSDGEGRGFRLLRRKSIQELEEGVWMISGLTSLRRLTRSFQTPLPETRHVTVNGILQEELGKIPEQGDEVDWGPFHFEVQDADPDGHWSVKLTLREVTQ
ncbi:MAG: CNNM domain-containing protein [Pirellulaceae bacterium]